MRRWLVGGVVLAVLAGGGVVAAVTLTGAEPTPPAPRRAASARVTEQDLVETTTVSGQLDYGAPSTVVSGQSGMLTWLPEVGGTVDRGAPLYKVDDQPVVAMYGTVPMYRDLGPTSSGNDVRQLEENLRALGFAGFTVDTEYTDATARAVRRWQHGLGLAETGTVELTRVVFVPEAVRIAEWRGRVGAPAAGDVLTYTGTTKVVTAGLDAAEQRLAHVGDEVTVRLPGGTTEATIAAVAPIPEDERGNDDAALRVHVVVTDQQALAELDGGTPVDVELVAQRRDGVLTVPVAALLALADGGFGIELTGGRHDRVLTVETGLFAQGRVEVRAPGLTEGMTVGVPAA